MAGAAELLVIAGDKENAERRRKLVERRCKAVGIGLCAVEEVAGHEDDVGS